MANSKSQRTSSEFKKSDKGDNGIPYTGNLAEINNALYKKPFHCTNYFVAVRCLSLGVDIPLSEVIPKETFVKG